MDGWFGKALSFYFNYLVHVPVLLAKGENTHPGVYGERVGGSVDML